MEKLTITEGLAEIKLIKSKINSKQRKIQEMLTRVDHLLDLFAGEGGSEQVVSREIQALSDLSLRLIKIRTAISTANLATNVTILDSLGSPTTASMHDWLIWKREIAQSEITFVSTVNRSIRTHMESEARQPKIYKDENDVVKVAKIKVNVDYPAWLAREASLNDLLQKLDGQLSLKNATVVIEF